MSSRYRRVIHWKISCLAALAMASTTACGDDSGGGEGGTDEAGEEGGTDGSPTPEPGAPAAGWSSDYADGGVGLSCDDDRATLDGKGVPHVSEGERALYVGFEQIGDNQNPIVIGFDGDAQQFCERHETEGPDGRAVGLTWDGGAVAYLVYTIVGGGSSLEGKGGWLSAYAPGAISGGGPKVSVVGKVNADTGALDSASFIISVKSDGKVNSHNPRAAPTVLEDGSVEFLGSSAHKPIDANGQASMDCTDYPFDTRYVLSEDLGALVCASSSNCAAELECEGA